MASVTLAKPDLALFADPAATRVVVPHLITATRTRRRELALVRFEGDAAPTPFRGAGASKTYEVTCRFGQDEHADMLALLDLLDLAMVAPDGRLQLRTAWYAAGGDQYEVVVAGDVSEAPLKGRGWDIRFVATTVAHTLAV